MRMEPEKPRWTSFIPSLLVFNGQHWTLRSVARANTPQALPHLLQVKGICYWMGTFWLGGWELSLSLLIFGHRVLSFCLLMRYVVHPLSFHHVLIIPTHLSSCSDLQGYDICGSSCVDSHDIQTILAPFPVRWAFQKLCSLMLYMLNNLL